ncbi:MAG TPA: response regulator [Chitinophagales bacterium]|nr:response regulator [Chitinophagales bacterium]
MAYQNILLIDDDIDDHEIFSAALGQLPGMVTYSAHSNATEALEQLTAELLKPDLIFLDLNMPVMNGQEFLTAVKRNEKLRNIPVIIFSTSSNSDTIRQTKELGAKDFITKPDRFDTLVLLLQSLLSIAND